MFPCPMPSVENALEIVHATPADVGEVAPLFDAYRQFYQKAPDLEAARRFLFARLSRNECNFSRPAGWAVVGFVQLYRSSRRWD